MAKFSVTVTRTDEYEIEELKKKVLKMSEEKKEILLGDCLCWCNHGVVRLRGHDVEPWTRYG